MTTEEEGGDTIEALMAIAMGCVGMGLDDFCRLTPSQFAEVVRQHSRHTQEREHAEWERTRMTCMCLLQPHSKSRLKPTDIMRFPWEEQRTPQEETQQLTREEIMERYKQAIKDINV